MLRAHNREHPNVLTSYAYGKWGCEASCSLKCFHFQRSTSMKDVHITIKELLPIVLVLTVAAGVENGWGCLGNPDEHERLPSLLLC